MTDQAADRATAQTATPLGLAGTTAVGVGAIVGGGIFVLSGAMVAEAGPAALVALGLNAVLAFLTVMSFAEMATMFPENGGEYAFARRTLSVRSAFAVGWVVWFAYAVAAALYALGFASYALLALDVALDTRLHGSGVASTGVALAATLALTAALARWGPRGGIVANAGKVVVFRTLIAAGLWALAGSPERVGHTLTPFAPSGGAVCCRRWVCRSSSCRASGTSRRLRGRSATPCGRCRVPCFWRWPSRF